MIDQFEKPKVIGSKLESEEIEVPQRIVDCMKKICDIIYFCLMIMNEHKIEEFLVEYKQNADQFDKILGDDVYLFHEDIDHIDIFQEKNEEEMNKKEKKNNLKREAFKKMDEIIDGVSRRRNRLEIDKNEEMFSIIVELIHYKDHNLKTSSIKILSYLYNQTKNMGQTILKLQLIDDQKAKTSYQNAKNASLMLDKIGDSIEKWYSHQDSAEIQSLIPILNKIHNSLLRTKYKDMSSKEEQGKAVDPTYLELKQTVSEINPLSQQKTKITASALDLRVDKALNDIHEYLMRSHDEIVDIFEQNLQRNTGILRSLMMMLEFDAETQEEEERNTINTLMLKKFYRILSKTCKDNDLNKEFLSDYLDSVIIKHFQLKTIDVNASFLIREMVINNKVILLNEAKVKKLTQTLCMIADDIKNDNEQKGHIISIMSEMLKYKDFVLSKNQNSVLSMIINKDFKNLRVHFESQDLENELMVKARNKMLYKNLKIIDGKKVLVLPNELSYIVSFLNLLSGCAESKNAFSENICQNMISLE